MLGLVSCHMLKVGVHDDVTSSPEERRSIGRLGLVAVAVGATLVPVAVLVTYIRNLLAGDPPAHVWVIGFGVCLVLGLLGSVLLGVLLWNDQRSQNSRQLTLSLVGVGIASAAAFLPAAFIVIP